MLWTNFIFCLNHCCFFFFFYGYDSNIWTIIRMLLTNFLRSCCIFLNSSFLDASVQSDFVHQWLTLSMIVVLKALWLWLVVIPVLGRVLCCCRYRFLLDCKTGLEVTQSTFFMDWSTVIDAWFNCDVQLEDCSIDSRKTQWWWSFSSTICLWWRGWLLLGPLMVLNYAYCQ